MISGLKQGKTGSSLTKYSRIDNSYYQRKNATGNRVTRLHRYNSKRKK